jgi:MoaA/NifB/PqqE/SkfB family radical SAM enzyme
MSEHKYVKIKRAVIEVEGGCNYSCQMCPQIMGRGDFDSSIPFNKYKKLIDECSDIGVEVVQLDGSGEATLNKNLPKYIEYAVTNNIKTQIFSNGYLMNGSFMEDCVDAGLSLFRFSVIGYDRRTYKFMTGRDHFEQIKQNVISMKQYIDHGSSDCEVCSYHLIINDLSDIEKYKKNFINIVKCKSDIWKMHNWAGVMDINKRDGVKKTCGRPFAEEITIRAGGINGHTLAVTPCCQTLGRDEEAVLSHCDDKSILEAYNSERYNWLRMMHSEERFDEIPFCKDCDFLYDDLTVLVWTNSTTKINNMMGTTIKLR